MAMDLDGQREKLAKEAFSNHDFGIYTVSEVNGDWSGSRDVWEIAFWASNPDPKGDSLSGFFSMEFAPESAEIVGTQAGVDGELLTPGTAPTI